MPMSNVLMKLNWTAQEIWNCFARLWTCLWMLWWFLLDKNSHKLDKYIYVQLSWADKNSAHVNAPILHQALAKYLGKQTTTQDSCDGEDHIFFQSSKQSLQASKNFDQLQNKGCLFLQVEFAQLYMKCLLLE